VSRAWFRVVGFQGWDFGCRVSSWRFQVSDFELEVSGFGFRVLSWRFRVPGFELEVSGFGFGVRDLRQRPSG
jgi:hypothetical protein